MKGLKKKALSALLTLAMVVGMLQPMAAEAAEATNVALNKSAKVGFAAETTVTDPTNSQSPASKGVDGNKSSAGQFAAWNDNYEKLADNVRPSVYFEVDLGQLYDLSSVKMWRYWDDGRTYKETMIIASKDANFNAGEDDTVIYNAASEAYSYGYGAGEDAAYAETSSGHEFAVAAGTQAQYVRVYMRGNSNPSNPNHAGNHLVELEVYGTEPVEVPEAVDKTALEAAITEANALNPDEYKDFTAVKAAIDDAWDVKEDADATQAEVDAALAALETAVEALEKKETEEPDEPFTETEALPNATVYQSFPTHYQDKASAQNADGSLKFLPGQVVHPDVVYVEDGWNGYKYWAVYTPNVMSTSQYENPYIAASNDGATWVEPAGIVNPIEPEPINTALHNCDADMIYNEEMDAMMAYWNWANDNNWGEAPLGAEVRVRISYDGIHWGVPSTYDEETGIWTKPADESERTLKPATTDKWGLDNSFITAVASKDRYDMLSPTFVYDSNRDIYLMWANNTGNVGYNNGQRNFVEIYWSEDGLNWSEPMKVNNFLDKTTSGASIAPWHQDVNYIPELKMFVALSQCFTGGSPDGSMLYMTVSKDGINWQQIGTDAIMNPGADGAWDDFQIYRSCFVYDNGLMKVWYSALQKNTAGKQVIDENGQLTLTATSRDTRVWRIGYSENEYVDIMKIQTGDVNYVIPEFVTGTALELTAAETALEIGDDTVVTAAFTPAETSDQLITYTSSDENVITVSPFGVIEAVGEGTATVTASTADEISGSVEFTVTAPEKASTDTYLSDLDWIEQSCGGGFTTAKDTNVEGGDLKVLIDGAEKTFEKGLGVHAPSSVTYNIAGKGYMKFQAYAGVDYFTIKDYPGEAIVGNFIVKIDGEVVAESGEMNPSMDAYYFDITIPADAKTLTLETEIGEAQDWSDWADWADAKLIVELGDPENLALNKPVTVKKTADDSAAAVNSDRPAAMAVDGVNNSSDNYCDFGSDGADESIYLQVDLGKLCMLDTVNLYRYWNDGRTYDGTVIALSETSDFADPTVIYNSDAANVHGFGAGTDATYAETEEGMSFDADYAQGRFLRVYMAGSNSGTTNHIVEVEAWGYEIEGDPVPAESVEITATRISYEKGTTIKEGRKAYLEASILPLESTDEIVSWASADEAIATVEFDGDECTVTGVSAGDVEITATTTSGATGTVTINVLEKKDAAPLRRVVDAEHILYLENYYWSDDFANKNGVAGNVPQDERVDSPVMLWETVPDSLKENTVILLIAERSLNNTTEIKQWIKDNVELCNANNIPCAVQNVNGETRMANPIPIEFWEELVQENEYFVGFNGAELYNRFNGDAREYMVDLIQMGVENGIHMMWTDTNTFDCETGNGGNSGVLVDWLEYCPDLAQVMRDNKEYISLMYKESYGNPSTEALYVGMWLTDYIGNWGIASDWWHWQLDSNGALFGAGSGGDAWKQCLTWPEAMYTMDILRAASQGATCFKSEAQWYSNATKGMRTPGYQYSIAPFLEKLASGEYKIPSKAEVAAHTKAVVVGRNNWNDFIYDKSYSQLYPKTDKYGIVPFVPSTCPEEALEGFALVITENLGAAALQAKLDEVYAADVTGGTAYAANYGDTYYFMNSSEDKDVTQNAIITPQVTDGVDSVEITGTPHTYGVITEKANEITFSLGNYRIDKTEIWTDSKYAGGFSDMDCYSYVWEMCERMGDLADPTDDTNHDTELRETVIKVTCDAEPVAVFAEDNEYTRPYTYTENYADGVYTLTLKHNGIVDVDIVMEEVKVTAIDLGEEELAMVVGESVQLTAETTPADATTNVEWTSSDESVVTVVSGKVFAKAAGTATITAKADGVEAAIEVTVTEIEVTGLELDADAVTILEGETATVKATVTPGNATNKAVTWTSSDESVATVVNGTITGVKAGTATITAETANGLKVDVAVTVEVNPSHEIPQSSMTATSDSEYAGTTEGPASNVLDGDLGTIWHSNYAPKDELPVYIELDLNGTYDVHKVVYVPRSGAGNGTITSYELYITDAEGNETLLTSGAWELNADAKTVEFDPVEATKVKVKVLEGKGGFASAAEFKVFYWGDEVEVPVEEGEVVRISGKDRYATGYAAAEALKEALGVDKFDAVVVATGKNFADALSGSYLAIVKEAPILLTNGKDDNVAELHAYIKENVNANGTVYILGGTAAVPATVEAIEGYTVKRLAGASRYDTNLEILAEAGITGTELIVATGKEFADSLSASATGRPILLVKPGAALSAEQKAIVETVKDGNIYVVGGTGAVAETTAAELEAYATVERIAGSGRQETSKKIAEKFFADAKAVVAANAKNFPDGLCGGPLAAAMNAPLLLTATGNTAIAEGYVQGNGLTSGVVLGGTGALSDEAVVDVFGLESAEDIVVK